jgi:hypothetical protein
MKNTIRLIIVVVIVIAVFAYVARKRQQAGITPKAQEITCVNDLKQIGLAFRMWAGDHSGQYPFNVSTNAGGTRELAEAGQDGFAVDSSIHFRVMTNDGELSTPLLLICSKDHLKTPAKTFAELTSNNVTYRICIGTNVAEANPKEALVICPIDGNTLYTDGTVTGETNDPHAMHVHVP